MHRDTVTRSWGPLLCHSSMTITSCCSMIMHGPMLKGSVHNSWKLEAQFLHGQHTHWTSHPLSMFGMLWIGVYDSVFQFLPISSNFAQPLKRSGPTFHRPQSTAWSTLCEGDMLHCVRQMVVTPDTDWFSDPHNTVKLHILEWPFIVASLRHTCAIIMLRNQHLFIFLYFCSVYVGGFWWTGDGPFQLRKHYYGLWTGILAKRDGLKLNLLNNGFFSLFLLNNGSAFHFSRCKWWTGVVPITYGLFIVMFLWAVWTLILMAPIHCKWSIEGQVM